jgi:hypothetical protein
MSPQTHDAIAAGSRAPWRGGLSLVDSIPVQQPWPQRHSCAARWASGGDDGRGLHGDAALHCPFRSSMSHVARPQLLFFALSIIAAPSVNRVLLFFFSPLCCRSAAACGPLDPFATAALVLALTHRRPDQHPHHLPPGSRLGASFDGHTAPCCLSTTRAGTIRRGGAPLVVVTTTHSGPVAS